MNDSKISEVSSQLRKSISTSKISGICNTIIGVAWLIAGFTGLVSEINYMNPYGVFGGFFIGLGLGAIVKWRSDRKIVRLLAAGGKSPLKGLKEDFH